MIDAQGILAAEIARLTQMFVKAGGELRNFDVLQPAHVFLDLYGEDIRSRAYTTRDGLEELMLRPDFTVPVVAEHMRNGAEPARYTYSGSVWRKASSRQNGLREHTQVGFELFDGADTAESDAEVFALISKAVSGQNLSVATGDMGVLVSTLEALDIQPDRKSALRRHLWRPERFRSLLNTYASPANLAETRRELLATYKGGALEERLEQEVAIGLRDAKDITARLAVLAAEAEAEPMAASQISLLDQIFALKGSTKDVLLELKEIAKSLTGLEPALTRLERRIQALEKRDIDAENLPFEVSYGRTTLEYYDGFVFGFYAQERPDLPVIASGGRYDALTRELGQGAGIPAVGGVVRPDALLSLTGAKT